MALSGARLASGQSAADDQTIEKAVASQATENLPPDAMITGKASAPSSPMAWWYRTPATKFWEGLPIGSGRFGAMVYGRVRDEVIPFNDETLWTGQPHNPVNPKALASLPEIRRLLLVEKFGEAAELATNLLSHPVPVVQTYQAMGRLNLRFDGHDEVQDYRRELDMDSAIARVDYRIGDAYFTREAFASYPDQVVVIRLTCDRPGRLTFNTRLSSLHASAVTRVAGNDTVLIEGGVSEPNPEIKSLMRWQARVRVIPEGGSLRSITNGGEVFLRVEKADAVTLILAGATNYKNWRDISADPDARCAGYLQGVAQRSFAGLRQRHVDDYQPLFRACQLDLGTTDAAKDDTTTRLDKLRQGGSDPHFTAEYFQYGRYLLLAGSRPGTMAFNNHNLWLDDLKGRWRGRWTLNINLQECYWPAENANLPGTVEALASFVEDLAASGERTAKGNYGARGWCAHHGTDVWMNTAMTDRVFHGMAPQMGAWLMQSLWEHYLYDPDPDFLKRIYPLLKGAAEFGLDMLVEEPTHQWLVPTPSGSPENGFLLANGRPLMHGDAKPKEQVRNSICAGSAMDNELLRDLFRETIEAATKLGVDAPLRAELSVALPRLAPPQVRADGTLMEWLKPYLEFDPKHRHVSHLYAAFPGNQITRRGTPELAEAVRKTLRARGDNHGWSAAWKINLLARLGDAEDCHRIVQMMQTDISIHPAPEDSDRVPSMEGNQGIQAFTAGIAEMLLQSHAGEIELLPALPKAWPTGSVRGLRARGGYTVDLAWQDGKLATATLTAKYAGLCRLRMAGPVTIRLGDKTITPNRRDTNTVEFTAAAGGIYTISASTPEEWPSLRSSLLPAVKQGGFRMEGYILWCPSVIKVGGSYHLFASRWPAAQGMGGWTRSSEIVRATSTNLFGPYAFQEVVLQKRTNQWDNTRAHNPKVVKVGDRFVLYYIDTANETGIAVADAITGPWERRDQPVMRVSNPAPLVRPDNGIYVFGRLRDAKQVNRGIAFTAPHFEGPYSVVADGDNLLPRNAELEDPTIWWAGGGFNLLVNDWKGKATGTSKAGAQYFSTDGVHYRLVSPEPVFTKTVPYDDGTSETFSRRERPFVFVNDHEEVMALFTACLPADGQARIVVQPVNRYLPGNH
jgi:alpha-L-fucosidase 2